MLRQAKARLWLVDLMVAILMYVFYLSKAFDNVNHNNIFKKAVDLKCPANMVKLLIHWYSNQTMNVQWKRISTSCFYMMNGTRQDSV